MSGRARRDEVAPSLFPFLAVLLCTMGALVLILMLIVSNAQATAKEIAASVEAENISQEMLALSDEMQKVRESQQKELDRKQGELAHIENHINRLHQQIEDLVAKYEKLAEEKDKENIEQADWDKRRKELEAAIAKAEEELKEKEEDHKNKKPAYSIIPYQGPNGTSRRPIYLECVADGLIIQPDGFKLSLRDLKPPHGPGNPLDAVLRAIRNHLEAIEATGGATPYPLLIVRPDGIRTYAMARGAMASWDDQFGYELVGNEMDLKYPGFERPMTTELEKVVAQARERQIALIAAMPNRMRGMLDEELNGEGDQWGPIEGNGGDGSGDMGDGDGLAFAEDAEMIQKLPDGASAPNTNLAGTPNGTSALGGTRELRGSTSLGGAGLSSGQAMNGGQGTFGGGAGNMSLTSGARPSTGNGLNSGPFNAGNQGMVGQATGTSNGMTGGGGEAGEANSEPNAELNSQSTPSGTTALANKGPQKAGEFGYTAGNAQGDATGASSNGKAAQMAQNGKANSSAPPEDSIYRDVQGGSDSATGPAGGEGGPGFTMTSSNAAKSNQAGKEDKNTKPQSSSDTGPSGTGVVVSRGNDWTRQNIRGTAVERTIRIRCQEDRWVIQPEPGQQGTKTIFLRKGLVQAREDLSKALQGRVDSWGMALAGGYWKPKIVVSIDPNAQHRYEQLQRVLQGSGIDIVTEELPNGQKPK